MIKIFCNACGVELKDFYYYNICISKIYLDRKNKIDSELSLCELCYYNKVDFVIKKIKKI